MSCCAEGTAALSGHHRMRVRYSGGRSVLIKGPVTGDDYHFSGTARVQLVDPRDAIVIARNPSFRIEGIVDIAIVKADFSKRPRGHA